MEIKYTIGVVDKYGHTASMAQRMAME